LYHAHIAYLSKQVWQKSKNLIEKLLRKKSSTKQNNYIKIIQKFVPNLLKNHSNRPFSRRRDCHCILLDSKTRFLQKIRFLFVKNEDFLSFGRKKIKRTFHQSQE